MEPPLAATYRLIIRLIACGIAYLAIWLVINYLL